MSRLEYADTPPQILGPLRDAAMALPEAHEQQSWAGWRWRIRQRTFASVATVVGRGSEDTLLQFRSSGQELEVLSSMGHPFFRAGWGDNVVGMVLTAGTDWEEVGELLTESYCLMAPKKLAALLQPPLG